MLILKIPDIFILHFLKDILYLKNNLEWQFAIILNKNIPSWIYEISMEKLQIGLFQSLWWFYSLVKWSEIDSLLQKMRQTDFLNSFIAISLAVL